MTAHDFTLATIEDALAILRDEAAALSETLTRDVNGLATMPVGRGGKMATYWREDIQMVRRRLRMMQQTSEEARLALQRENMPRPSWWTRLTGRAK